MPSFKTSELPKPKSWEEFESMCADLIERKWKADDAQRYGRQEQEQYGIDILCEPHWMESKRCAVQVKKKKELTWADIEDEIDSAESSKFEIDEFYIFTRRGSQTTSCQDIRKVLRLERVLA